MELPGSVAAGRPHPLGAQYVDGRTNFSVWSRTADQIDLLLFDDVDDARPSRAISLDPHLNRTSTFWHILVPDVGPGQLYAWRVHGAFDPPAGLRHDASALPLDPYGSVWRCRRATTGWPARIRVGTRAPR